VEIVSLDAESAHLQTILKVYAEAACGNFDALLDALADDVQWTVCGSLSISRVYSGKTDLPVSLWPPSLLSETLEAFLPWCALRSPGTTL